MQQEILVFSAVVAMARLAVADAVDDVVRREMKAQTIPGVEILITKNDRVVKRAAYGMANLELGVKMRPGMLFESGSIGKSFTATVILHFWEQGKLSLDDPISKYLDYIVPQWSGIKIKNLLGQTSGLTDYAFLKGLGLAETWTIDDWFKRMSLLPLEYEPGSQFSYSNSNYFLLGLIAENIATADDYKLKHVEPPIPSIGDRFITEDINRLRQTYVFVPSGMTQTRPCSDVVIPGRVSGYYMSSRRVLIQGIKIAEGYGDGGILNTCEDLVKFERALRVGKLLRPTTVSMMQTSGKQPNGRKTHYGFGWFIRTIFGHEYISHGGNTGGFGSSLTRIPEKNLTVVVMTNQAQVIGDLLAQKIAVAYDPSLASKHYVESADSDPALSNDLKDSLVSLARFDRDIPMLSPELKITLATGWGKMTMPQYAPFANLVSFKYLMTEPDDPDRLLRYRVKARDRSYIVGFWVTTDRKVFQISVRQE